MDPIQVHFYDGKLNNIYTKQHSFDNIQSKKQKLEEYLPTIKLPHARQAYSMILRGLSTNKNYDPSNKIDASDVLLDLLIHPNLKDVQDIFEQQLADILEGKCSQGRVDRLLQIWLALYSN